MRDPFVRPIPIVLIVILVRNIVWTGVRPVLQPDVSGVLPMPFARRARPILVVVAATALSSRVNPVTLLAPAPHHPMEMA
jgi:hypothetical protein